MTENTFPVYKVDAIVTFFRTEVLTGQEAKHFTKNDLAPSPKPDAVQRLYMRILQLLYRFKPECHYMVPFSENIQHPQLHEWPTAVMSVYLRMRQFLRMCYVYDFSLNDLLAPKVKRTVTILSGIMNYLHFRKQRLDMTMGHQERFREDMDKLQAYSRGTKDAQKKMDKLTTIPPEQQAEARELDSALSDLQTNTMHQYQEVNAINENIAEWKTEMAEKSQKLTQLKVDVATLKENIGKLKSQIVESPEEMKIQMEKMKENVKNIKLAIETADERLVGLQSNVQGVTHSEADIQLIFKLLQDLQSSMNKTQQHQEEAQALVCVYEAQQKELKNHGVEEGQLKRSLGMKMDKESKQHIRRQKKKEIKDQYVEDVLGQCDNVHQKREQIADQIQERDRDSQHLRSQMTNLRDTCSQETEKAQDLFDRLLAALDHFHKRIQNHVVEGNNDIVKMTANF
ncbi:kinetochore protein Nuf2 isoform X2 [Oncorhynchus kisutch]|uniref:UF2 component of NDC80 kinetochore complex n=2 Tax=Oncorhynchus kisutch TaxID=8019 RepID=A0A8C7CK82_ONCKI|nr:kinetochore protein Nuf2 isoform X2 [Oncorhynchus kisutch]XP_031672185.1 kinetochore protein Nuf2 isoform X2 [Oncorhynchus kisutch]